MRGSGVLFEEVTLVERIGPEAVALLIDPEPGELLAREPFTLNLKPGIAATNYGPVLFLVWWVPPFINGRPSAFYEQMMNPLHTTVSEILQRVAEQSHLHVLLTDMTGQVVTVFEYSNTFGFEKIRASVDGARVAWRGRADFTLAKKAYQQQYNIDDVLADRYG
jgi:hypothetical protein